MKTVGYFALLAILTCALYLHGGEAPLGFVALLNSTDLSGWKADEAARAHWTVKDGVLD